MAREGGDYQRRGGRSRSPSPDRGRGRESYRDRGGYSRKNDNYHGRDSRRGRDYHRRSRSRSYSPRGRGGRDERDGRHQHQRYSDSRRRSNSRSPSPRGGGRHYYGGRGGRGRSRSASPDHRNSRQPPKGSSSGGSKPQQGEAKAMAASLESEFFETKGFDQEQEAMMKMMGFGSFESTQGEKVRGNEEGTVKVKSTRQVRQFMNRRGGFNRPLPAERTGQKLNDL